MKILWLVNLPLPEVSLLMNEKPSPFGGWLVNASKYLSMQKDIELSIAFPSHQASNFKTLKGEKITYYPFQYISESDTMLIKDNKFFREILRTIKPDIVHIYGTEMPHTLSMVNACNSMGIEVVISMQGLVSIIANHMYASLPFKVVYGTTYGNLIRKDSVYRQRKSFEASGKNEIESLSKVSHIIGRTTWDQVCSAQINPQAQYHFCNEVLREEFYNHCWDINNCEKNSIFLSQGQYSIKGLHYVIEAMPLILKRFPKTKVYVSGVDITKSDTLRDKVLKGYYRRYIIKIIRRLNLEDNIIFTGHLDENEMCKRFLKSHVFVSPSSIENESNSLSEAKILGVPSIASYVGGVIDRIDNGVDGFHYQHDAPYMLAYYVCEVFENENLALSFSEKARASALKTHDREINTKGLIEIYNKIISGGSIFN